MWVYVFSFLSSTESENESSAILIIAANSWIYLTQSLFKRVCLQIQGPYDISRSIIKDLQQELGVILTICDVECSEVVEGITETGEAQRDSEIHEVKLHFVLHVPQSKELAIHD